MDPLALAGAAALVKDNAVVREALNTAGEHIRANSANIANKIVDQLVVATQAGFNEFLVNSYHRCRFFKTILAPSQPLEVVNHYVNVALTKNGKDIPDIDLINGLPIAKSVIVTGLAGSGKSMLMKYLTVLHFENPRGAIPLFVELRRINHITEKDLLSFTRASCTSATNSVSERQFEMALASGAFMLILDGFDEVHDEFKNEIERQIIDLRYKFPKACIVVSSRPSDRFMGWNDFSVYNVKELSRNQCISLVNSFYYDEGVKKRFIKELKASLFSTHETFLRYPLLVAIMLLTFEEEGNVPSRMHDFYKQAFDTLFQKHDASKEQYTRRTKSGLEREEFRLCFAAFCAFTYLNHTFSFRQDQLNESSANAIKYLRSVRPEIGPIRSEDFTSDLFDAVCMLHMDGTEAAFVHRSFQEYFAAVFATRLSPERMVKVLDKYATRFFDSPIMLAFAIQPETVEANWVAPTVDMLLAKMGDDSVSWLKRYSEAIPGRLGFRRGSDKIYLVSYGLHPETLGPLESIGRLYPNIFKGVRLAHFAKPAAIAGLKKIIADPQSKNEEVLLGLLSGRYSLEKHSEETELGDFEIHDERWMESLGARESFNAIIAGLRKVKTEVAKRISKQENLIESLI